jgi:hypothetical protein
MTQRCALRQPRCAASELYIDRLIWIDLVLPRDQRAISTLLRSQHEIGKTQEIRDVLAAELHQQLQIREFFAIQGS